MKIKVKPQNIEIEVTPGDSVMEICHKNDVYIKSVCNGQARCAECRVKVVKGASNVTPPNQRELEQVGSGYFIDQRRLSCQMYCYGDVEIDVTEQVGKKEMASQLTVSDMRDGQLDQSSFAVRKRLIEEE